MIRLIRPIALIGLLFATNCQQTVTPPVLRSLANSGEMSLICRDMTTGQGQDINGCPDAYATTWDGRHTLLMVTQTKRGEVAVIDMTTRVVLDQDPTVPGTEFLPIGAYPVSIASTPGGASTFVATAELGREGIFALPTSCAVAPSANQPARDLTQWSACKLPSTPGKMTIVADSALGPSGELRRTCDGDGLTDVDPTTRTDCPADWDAEQRTSPPGRRKILVTLPNYQGKGGIAILDARNLFDRTPGTFEDCTIERWLPLSPTVPTGAQAQNIPADLEDPLCTVTPRYSFGPPPMGFFSRPAGIALKDGQLYVADLGTPLVHVLDVKNPCDPHELPPLLPTSYDKPTQTVYTSNVAVSELTSSGERFVYAVDDDDGSLMAFDVSPSSTQKTPIIHKGSPYLPYYSPDRIQTNLQNASVKDLLFVTHDVPIVDSGKSTSQTGLLCDPTPKDPQVPNYEYRTSSDYTRGASPSKLRGTFAIAALSNGQIGVVDVEDWDAPCRRPTENNPSATADWRGCKGDGQDPYTDATGTRTVSDESSCKVVEQHYARSGRFIANNSTVGTSAPSLQTFPTLTSITGNISTDSSSRRTANPRMLAVPYPNTTLKEQQPSEVFVGSSLYYLINPSSLRNATFLNVEPAVASNNSLLLPQVEPRTYLPTENFSATFEGKLFDDRQTGLLSVSDSDAGVELSLSDRDVGFCDQGVQDSDAAAVQGKQFASTDPQLSANQLASFASTHTDILQVTSDFTDSDPYWSTPVGSACAKSDSQGIVGGINGCRTYFGTSTNFKLAREWTIREAYQDHLVLDPGPDATKIANLHCCFPGTVLYTVRASNTWLFRGQQPMTNVVVGPNNRCVIDDCSPRKKLLKNRIIEISSTETCGDTCSIGAQNTEIVKNPVCVVSKSVPLDPNTYASGAGSIGPGCIFDSLKGRFAIYSGTNPSVRDMSFGWQVVGGFVPYELNLANHLTGSAIMPQSMLAAPNLNAFFVVEGVSGGVFEVVLDPFEINGDPYL